MTGAAAPERVVVAGGGVAAHVVATTLRSEGFRGSIEVLTAEDEGPYDRPPLSKEGLREAGTAAGSFGVAYDDVAVTVRTSSTVTAVDEGVVHSTTGAHPYDALVLATGSSAVTLPGQSVCPRAMTLRTRADASVLRGLLRPGARLVVIGAGWIGAEVATQAVARGCQVTVVDAAVSPLAAALPSEIGARMIPWYAAAGVTLRLGTGVQRIDRAGVVLDDGSSLEADAVVVGVGARPETAYLGGNEVGINLADDGSVPVDALLRANEADVYAVGDVARWTSSRFGTLRTEHWDHAVLSATHVARALCGADVVGYDPVPYVWSDQWGRRLQYAGHHSPQDRLVISEGRGDDDWSAWWLAGDRLTAAFAIDQPRAVRAARRAIDRGRAVDADELAHGDQPWAAW